ncbi:MAG: tyrosine-protein phosphatase [archaeon]|nr:tyrosine-protein phosphatase [archaeon]
MNEDKRTIIASVIALVVLANVVAGTAVFLDQDQEQKVFVCETIGQNSYTNPVFDLTLEDLLKAGYSEGDTFDVEIEGTVVRSATLTHGFLGVFMFDTYLNTEKDGHLAAGVFWDNVLPNDLGNTVTVTHVGHNDNYSKLDRFLTDYSNDIADYGGDGAVFANFYGVTGGDIVDGRLYRSYNPFLADNARRPYVNGLAEEAGIGYVVTLSMTPEAIRAQIDRGAEGYCIDLFENGDSTATNIGYRYFANTDAVKDILTGMTENDGPYLVHCNVGRDRTGFTVTLLQALCGAGEADMKASAANAYVNLYGVDPGSEEYKVVVESTYCRNIYYICNYDMIGKDLIGGEFPVDWSGKKVDGVDIRSAAHDYCTEYLSMDGSVVDRLIAILCS